MLPYDLEHFRRVPSAYIAGPVNFDTVSSFIIGAQMVTDGLLLIGFREWLMVLLDDGNRNCQYWTELVLALIFPDVANCRETLNNISNQEEIVENLFDLLCRFFEEKRVRGLHAIYLDYEQLMSRYKWYKPNDLRN